MDESDVKAYEQTIDRAKIERDQIQALAYLQGDFQTNFTHALIDKRDTGSINSSIKLAELQSKYAHALMKISGGVNLRNINDEAELQEWNTQIVDTLFNSDNPDSLSSKALENGINTQIEDELAGATSILTFMSLWQEMYPDRADVSIKITDGKLDAEGKVDIKIETSNSITLVQLKTNANDRASVIKVDEIRDYLVQSGGKAKVSEADVVRMITEQRKLQKEQAKAQSPKRVDLAIVEVPGIHSPCIDNVFGVIKDEEKRNELVQSMRNQAVKSKLVDQVAA